MIDQQMTVVAAGIATYIASVEAIALEVLRVPACFWPPSSSLNVSAVGSASVSSEEAMLLVLG